MRSGVAVIIPALNEETSISESIDAAFASGAEEVVVADGGSGDRTCDVATSSGARVVTSEKVRGSQLNAGARASTAPFLLFVHADTILPPGACEAVRSALATGSVFGGFRIAFREPSIRLRVVASLINFRCAITREPWGDQGQFISRAEFTRAGEFRNWPIMEDYEFARRMKRRGRACILTSCVRTSGCRFLGRGIIRTTFTNWRVIAAYERGVPPEQLAALYRS